MNQNLSKRCVAGFIGTFALIFIGAGAIHNGKPRLGMELSGVAIAIELVPAFFLVFVVYGSAVHARASKIGEALAGLNYGRFLLKEYK